MAQTGNKQVFYHVGTGKTGTTYLQYRVFPFFKGIQYIQRNHFKRYAQMVKESPESRILLSREFDQQLEYEVKLFAPHFPDTTPIIVFRRHDQYIASQYRRFVKNGFKGSFEEFFDVENDQGYFKHRDLNYRGMLDILRQHFRPEPIVLFYDDLQSNPIQFIEGLAAKVGATVDAKSLNLSKKHASYNENQLLFFRQMSQRFNLWKRTHSKNKILNVLGKLRLGALRYSLLFIGKFWPVKESAGPLIKKESLEKVRLAFEEDWKAVRK
jgi:hypothetical protein